MINFDELVLGPCMDAFARPAIYYPVKSQPSAPAFVTRGIWAMKPADMQLEDGSLLAADQWTFGVRGSEFLVAPSAGDRIDIPAVVEEAVPQLGIPERIAAPAIGLCDIEDEGSDGQGGYILVLKKVD